MLFREVIKIGKKRPSEDLLYIYRLTWRTVEVEPPGPSLAPAEEVGPAGGGQVSVVPGGEATAVSHCHSLQELRLEYLRSLNIHFRTKG